MIGGRPGRVPAGKRKEARRVDQAHVVTCDKMHMARKRTNGGHIIAFSTHDMRTRQSHSHSGIVGIGVSVIQYHKCVWRTAASVCGV